MTAERLQKILAQAGIASRRAAEALITEGRVRVNGRIVRELGTRADAHKDRIEVNGKRVVAEKPVYFVLNKPREVVTTLDDPEGRETIKDLLRRIPERVYPVGRLDYHTSGVLLVTNDGEMAQSLLHPRKQVPKTYVVKLRGHIDVPELDALRNGVDIGEAKPTAKAEVFVLREDRGNTWLQMTIKEGKNRQIHRMLEALGFRVMRLSRVSFAGIELGGIKPGEFRVLGDTELRKLKRDYLNPSKRARAEAAEEDEAAQIAGPLASARTAMRRRPTKKRAAKKRPAPREPVREQPEPRGKVGARKQADPRGTAGARKQADPRGTAGARKQADPRGTAGARKQADPRGTAGARKQADPRGTAGARKQGEPRAKAGARKQSDPRGKAGARKQSDPRGKAGARKQAGSRRTREVEEEVEQTRAYRSPAKRGATKKRAAPAKPPARGPRKSAQKRAPAKRGATKKSQR